MNVLVLGRGGQVARSLVDAAVSLPVLNLRVAGRPEFDLAVPGRVTELITAEQPDVVINAAAYTAVDRAESEPEIAHRINADAAGEATVAAEAIGARSIYISTDYVFDGTSGQAYREDDATTPLNVYGRTKLAGEQQVRAASSRHLIIRTSWVVSAYGTNFVKTMLRLAGESKSIRVVDDQRGCPTSAADLAAAILRLAKNEDWDDVQTLHVAGLGAASWADLASEIFAVSASLGGPSAAIERIVSADYPTPALRPADTRLDCANADQRFGIVMPDWRSSIAQIVFDLVT